VPTQPAASVGRSPLLQIEDLKKDYLLGGVPVTVLHGVSFEVRRGEVVSLMGSSGCGKSTLLGILGLLDRQTSGLYRLNGEDVTRLNDDQLAQFRNLQIGFVFQSFHLLPMLSIAENVALPLMYRALPDAEIHRRASEMLGRVGLEKFANHRPSQLSGGMQQRVAIARALTAQPSLLLADEPTGALDTKTSDEIMHLFREVNERLGVSMVYVTHDPHAADYADRILRLRDGRLVGEEAPDRAAAG
jgi:putative ABC transport system ATP-binding protein